MNAKAIVENMFFTNYINGGTLKESELAADRNLRNSIESAIIDAYHAGLAEGIERSKPDADNDGELF